MLSALFHAQTDDTGDSMPIIADSALNLTGISFYNQNSTAQTDKDSTVNSTVNIQDFVSITAVSIKKATNGYTLNELDYVTGEAKGFRLRPTTT